MIFVKELILKGVAGLAVVGSAGAGVWWYTTQKPENNTQNEPTNELETLAEKVGLECPTSSGTPNETTGVQCNKKADSATTNIKVKKENDTTFNLSSISGGKIKVYKLTATGGETTGYNKDFKFVIEEADIGSGSSKLEEFETYEVKEETEGGGEWKLIRKEKAVDVKKKLLGLPDGCNLPENNGPNTCDVNSSNVNNINFDGKTSAALDGGTLKIEIASSADATDFPYGFKFTLTPTNGNLTINRSSGSLTVKANKGEEFKIKKSGSSLTLEEAWTLDTLTKKVGLSCSGTPTVDSGVQCSKGSTDIKVKNSSSFDLSNISGNGNIKVYKDDGTGDYNKDLKFVIEDNDISSGGNKLEEFETYEIKKDGNEWKLTRKNEAKEFIKKALGIPDTCQFPTNGDQNACDISNDKFKKVKFDGISVSDVSGHEGAKLKITITPSGEETEFPHGYKFVLESNKDISFPNTSKSIKKGTNTEFRIKKSATGNALTLEKAWTVTTLGKKVGLTCQTEGDKTCTLEDGNINVHNGADDKKYSGLSKKTGTSDDKKVKYEEDVGDHNQGIKFYVENDDICLQTNGGQDGGDDNKKIEKLDTATYEVKKDSEVWYLYKKPKAAAG